MPLHSCLLLLWTLLVCTGELCKRWHNPFESGGMLLVVGASIKWWWRIGMNSELLSQLCGFLKISVELCTLVRPSEFLSSLCVRGCTLGFSAHQPWCHLAWRLSDCCRTGISPEVSVDAFFNRMIMCSKVVGSTTLREVINVEVTLTFLAGVISMKTMGQVLPSSHYTVIYPGEKISSHGI